MHEQLTKFIIGIREAVKDGLTLAEIAAILAQFVQMAVAAASALTIPGESKKQVVLTYVGQLFDVLYPAIPFGWFAIFKPAVHGPLKAIVLAIVGQMIEIVYENLKLKG